MKQHKPILHGRDHLSTGADPVPGLLPPPTPVDYPGAVLAHPCLTHYWPGDETTGDLIDRKGDEDMALADPHTYPTGTTQPHYGDTGPFDEGCVGNSGLFGNIANHAGRFSASPADPATPYTIEAWALLTRYSFTIFGSDPEVEVGQCTLFSLGSDANTGYVKSETGHSLEWTTGSEMLVDPDDFPLDTWQHLAFRADGTTLSMFRNGILRDSTPSTSTGLGTPIQWLNSAGSVVESPWNGSSAHLALYNCALDDATIIAHSNMLAEFAAGGHAGEVPTIGDDGTVTWEQPKVDVTVNGEPPAAPTAPPGPLPTDPNDVFPDDDDWIVDQPFLRGGGSFDVPPNKWTTIPFTSPLMERWSNVTGEGTMMTELDWDDPAAGGWINPDEPHAITIPHDMPFIGAADGDPIDWMQVCLRLEGPMVEPGTYRALRIFETTHQKTVVDQKIQRAEACEEHGAVDARREAGKPGTGEGGTGDLELWASGDTGGFDNGNHDTIYLVPNSGEAFYLPGKTWLPGHAGFGIEFNPTLKKGMRLVAQVWHDASIPLTFHCDQPPGPVPTYGPYRPHFVIWQTVKRSWGSPWSDWPLYT